MNKKDFNQLVKILALQAQAADNSTNFFRSITDSANLPEEWTLELNWTGSPDRDSRTLIKWALAKGINPEDNTFHTLGSILCVLVDKVGLDIGHQITTLIFRYNFCQNQDVKEKLTRKFRVIDESDSEFQLNKQIILNRLKESPIYLGYNKQPIIPLNFSYYNEKDNKVYDEKNKVIIIDKFKSIGQGRRMLILGESGSGKTTLLNTIFCTYINDALKNTNNSPIPFIINLSLWNGRTNITTWFIEQISYYFPKKIVNHLFKKNQILLLLDGLNELKEDYRNLFVKQFKDFCRDDQYLSTEIIICSQFQSYQKLNDKLGTGFCTILLKKLSPSQIKEYLQFFDPNLAIEVINDSSLLNLAETPLMLDIIKRCYDNNVVNLPREREFLFEFYIQEMLKENKRYSRIMQWLNWLAIQMEKNNQTSFFIDSIRPNWLDYWGEQYTYPILFRATLGLVVGFIIGLISLLMNDQLSLQEALISGIVSGIVSMLISSLPKRKDLQFLEFVTKFSHFIVNFLKKFKLINVDKNIEAVILKTKYIILYAFISVSIFSLITVFNSELFSPLGSLAFGLIFSVIFERIEMLDSNAGAVESIEWLWNKFFKSSIFGIAFGLMIGVIDAIFILFYKIVISNTIQIKYLVNCGKTKDYILKSRYIEKVWCNIESINQDESFIYYFLSGTITLCIFVALIFGVLLATEKIPVSDIISPKIDTNQQILKAISNSIILIKNVGFTIAIIFWITWGLYFIDKKLMWWVVYGSNISDGISFGIIAALGISLISGLIGGGNSGIICIQHFTLRLIIYFNDCGPWNYKSFLEYAVQINLLKRETSSYKFFHPDIQKHLSITKNI